jgi:peptidylprolyl isomerase
MLASLALVVGLTAACSAVKEQMGRDTSTASAATEVASTSVDDVRVTGGAGKGQQPKVAFPKPLAVTATQRAVLKPGKGAVVRRGQRLTVDYLGINATDGNVFDSSYARGRRKSFLLTDSGSLIQGLVEGLQGVKVGPTDTLIFVVDVFDAGEVLKRAKGTPVKPKPGLPTVALKSTGEPKITLPKGDPPASLAVQTLIRGKGAKVDAGESITVHYKAVIWPGGREYHSTWDKGEPETFEIGTGRVLTGLDSGLLDQTVGSQVLIVIPPDQGYGAVGKPDAGIKGTDTLVFVVDILEAV